MPSIRLFPRVSAIVVGLLASTTVLATEVEQLWNVNSPVEGEQALRAALPVMPSKSLELQSQIVRSLGLQGRFVEAYALLDGLDQAPGARTSPVKVRLLLERGRLSYTTGDYASARGFFELAFARAAALGEEGLAVDAANMVAITQASSPEGKLWSQTAVTTARRSSAPLAAHLLPAVVNNLARESLESGDAVAAAPLFEESAALWEARGNRDNAALAKAGLAQSVRRAGRPLEALNILASLDVSKLSKEARANVHEEQGEALVAVGQRDGARRAFETAALLLSTDEWSTKNNGAQIHSLRTRVTDLADPK
jgi:tetratricopeptide (TPR) repeat protein